MSATRCAACRRAPRPHLSVTRPPLDPPAIAVWHAWVHRADAHGLDPVSTRELLFNAGGL